MLLDLFFVVLLVLAIIKGWRRGLIVAIFSILALIIGLAAAIKLSSLVAGYIGKAVNVSDRWLPVISFAVVFIGVVLLIRLGANAIEKAAEMVTLGWVNTLGGILLYIIIYITVLSVLLFYAEQINLISKETIANSQTYPFVRPWAPKAMNAI